MAFWRRKPTPGPPSPARSPLFEMVAAKGVEPVKLATLEGILTGTTFEAILPDLTAGYQRYASDDGPWLTGIRPALVSALAALPATSIDETAARWAATEEWQLGHTKAADLIDLVRDLCRLAATAEASNRRLYLWMSL
jgi:hypothetical protein